MAGDTPKKKRVRKVQEPEKKPFDGKIYRTMDDIIEFRRWVYFSIGEDGRLTWWETNFINSMKERMYQSSFAITAKQLKIIEQLKQKLYFYNPEEAPPLDPDGLSEESDPDGLPVVKDMDEYERAIMDELLEIEREANLPDY